MSGMVIYAIVGIGVTVAGLVLLLALDLDVLSRDPERNRFLAKIVGRGPIPKRSRQWLEETLAWLADTYGTDWLTDPTMILPRRGDFAMPDKPDEEDARRVFEAACEQMGVAPEHLQYRFVDALERARIMEGAEEEEQRSETLGLYRDGFQQRVDLDAELIADLDRLVAVSGHELAHVRLHRDTDIDPSREDYEGVIDVTAFFFGFGLFMARCAERHYHWCGPDRVVFLTKRIGYVGFPVICYALGLLAWLQGDDDPAWLVYLGGRATSRVRNAIRYLEETSDSRFAHLSKADNAGHLTQADRNELERQLRHAINNDNFETAARIRDEIRRRNSP